MNNVLNQTFNATKRARFATFAISILDKFAVLQQCKWNTIKIRLPRLIINAPCGSNFMTILDFFISRCKKWPLSRGYGSWGQALVAVAVAVAVVERDKQESMYGLSAGTKKVAVVERWPLVEVRLYYHYYCYLKKKTEKKETKQIILLRFSRCFILMYCFYRTNQNQHALKQIDPEDGVKRN